MKKNTGISEVKNIRTVDQINNPKSCLKIINRDKPVF